MVEIVEITDSSNKEETIKASDTVRRQQQQAAASSTTRPTPKKIPRGKKVRVPKKDLPSVGELLAHGSPESRGRPKTFCDVFGYPIFVAICFGISLLIFHYAPHDKSVQPRGKFSKILQSRRRQQQQQQHQYMTVPQQEKVPPTITTTSQQQAKIIDPEEKLTTPPPPPPKEESAAAGTAASHDREL